MGKIGAFGFSLIEVMIALAIFAVFITVFVISQGGNLADSSSFKEELKLRALTENEINKIIVHPPDLRPALTLTPKRGVLKDNNAFNYSIEYKQVKIPDMKKLMSNENDEEEDPNKAKNSGEERIYSAIKKNLQELLWQVQVTITNKETKKSFTLSTWIYNHKAKVLLE